MIGKKCKNKSFDKSKASHITDMYNYVNDLLNGQKESRVIGFGRLNIESTEHDEIIAEMVDLAEKSTRSKNPFCHFILSLQSSEHYENNQINDIVSDFIAGIGYNDCQTIWVRHGDTDNDHLHILLNRVDKKTYKCRSDSNDVDKIHKTLAVLCSKYGFSKEAHARYVELDGEVERIKYVDNQITIPDKARAYELHSGEKSVLRSASEELYDILQSAKSWEELHDRLAVKGFSYIQYGKSGAKIKTTNADTGEITEIKPSSIHRSFSFTNMQKRLGQYIPPKDTMIYNRKPEPMDGVPTNILIEFKKEKQENEKNINDEKSKLYDEYQTETENLKQDRQKIIDYITSLGNTWQGNDIAYNALQKAIKSEFTDELKKLTIKFKQKIIDSNKRMYPRAYTFESWIIRKHPEIANDIIDNIKNAGNTVSLPLNLPDTHDIDAKKSAFLCYHSVIRADRYRVGIRNDRTGQTHYFGCTKSISCPEHSAKNIIDNLKSISTWENKGDEHIYYVPISDDKEHILIDDVTKESLQQIKEDGLTPNCVIESSPNNYQVLFTLTKPKIDDNNKKYQQEAFRDLLHGLNMRYGDIGLSGPKHPHRAPGFYNIKKKYKKDDGTYPIVNIKEAQPVESSKLLQFIHFSTGYYKYKDDVRKNTSEKFHKNLENQNLNFEKASLFSKKNYEAIYKVHYDNIVNIIKNKFGSDKPIDRSVVNYKIAQRLVCTHHTPDEIANILAYSPKYIDESENRKQHNIQYTVNKVISTMTDDFVQKNKYWAKKWKIMEEKAVDEYITWQLTQDKIMKQKEAEMKQLRDNVNNVIMTQLAEIHKEELEVAQKLQVKEEKRKEQKIDDDKKMANDIKRAVDDDKIFVDKPKKDDYNNTYIDNSPKPSL